MDVLNAFLHGEEWKEKSNEGERETQPGRFNTVILFISQYAVKFSVRITTQPHS